MTYTSIPDTPNLDFKAPSQVKEVIFGAANAVAGVLLDRFNRGVENMRQAFEKLNTLKTNVETAEQNLNSVHLQFMEQVKGSTDSSVAMLANQKNNYCGAKNNTELIKLEYHDAAKNFSKDDTFAQFEAHNNLVSLHNHTLINTTLSGDIIKYTDGTDIDCSS